MALSTPIALSIRFTVRVDDYGSLGSWTKCEGLSVEYEIQEYKEGGENTFVHRLPGRAKYQNIKLTRPLTAAPEKVADRLTSFQPSIQTKISPGTAHIFGVLVMASQRLTAASRAAASPFSARMRASAA